jgi:transcriptional regulator with XRE-family HTH domain
MSSTNEINVIADRLLLIRTNLGLSQKEFADRLGISLRAEQNYERGDRALPSEVLLSLAKNFDIDPMWLLDGPETNPRLLSRSSSLDPALLEKAVSVVIAAIKESGRGDISSEQISIWIEAVYRFYLENSSGAGAEVFVKKILCGNA